MSVVIFCVLRGLLYGSGHCYGWMQVFVPRIGVRAVHVDCTCKLPVSIATVTKLGDQFAVELKDEDAAGLVVHHDDVTVSVHRHTFGAHQLP